MLFKRNHQHISKAYFGLVLLCLIGFNTGRTQTIWKSYTNELQSIRDTIESLVAKNQIPSMTIGVIKDGKIIWEEGFGWADKEKKVHASPHTIYSLGSMSKSICATGVMTLIEGGKINLEDQVNPIISPFKLQGQAANSDEVKIWHILSMSAGIPHGWTSLSNGKLPEAEIGKKELFQRFGLVTLPPGKVFHYANYSMGVGDLVMEKTSNQSIDQYMKKAVFQPLGMKNSLVTFKEASENQVLAVPYSSSLNPIDLYQFFPYGGGGYWSSTHDLIQYMLLHLKHKKHSILSASNIDLMHNFDKGPSNLFHLGWFGDGVKLISNGSISGYNSCLALVPSADLGVVVLTNMSSRNAIADQIAFSVIDQLAPNLPEGINREKYAALYETPYAQNEELLGIWKGQIKTGNTTLSLQFTFEEQIKIKINDQPEEELQNAVFTPSKKLTGAFNALIPVPEFEGKEPANCWLNLYLDGTRLIGNVAPLFSNEKGSFSYGAFVELKKE